MDNIINSLDAFLGDYFGINFPNVQITDIVEIIIIALFIYQLLIWVQNTRTWMLFRGLLVVIAFFILAALFQMSTILWLGEKLLNVALIMVIVVFQPELRKALEDLGRRRLFSFLTNLGMGRGITKRFEDKTISDMTMACFEMGAVKTGALIVVENQMRLDEVERTGITLDAVLTKQLLINIFEKNTPLHDGAVIIRGDRIVSATCYLPLSDNLFLSKELGTRHRAGVGISEITDSLTIIVSEETGKISVAYEGELERNLDADSLRDRMHKILNNPVEEHKNLRIWKGRSRDKK